MLRSLTLLLLHHLLLIVFDEGSPDWAQENLQKVYDFGYHPRSGSTSLHFSVSVCALLKQIMFNVARATRRALAIAAPPYGGVTEASSRDT